MENKESIKSTYFIVFILGIIETVLAFFGGPLVGIAVLIIALSLRSKLINAGEPVTNGVKLILIAAGFISPLFYFGFLTLLWDFWLSLEFLYFLLLYCTCLLYLEFLLLWLLPASLFIRNTVLLNKSFIFISKGVFCGK